jgi:hypothetical protein
MDDIDPNDLEDFFRVESDEESDDSSEEEHKFDPNGRDAAGAAAARQFTAYRDHNTRGEAGDYDRVKSANRRNLEEEKYKRQEERAIRKSIRAEKRRVKAERDLNYGRISSEEAQYNLNRDRHRQPPIDPYRPRPVTENYTKRLSQNSMNSSSFNSNYDNQGNRLTKMGSNNVMSLTMDALALHNDIIETKKHVSSHDPELEAVLRMSELEAGRRGGGMQPQKSALHEVLQFKDPNRFQETQFQRENSFNPQPPPNRQQSYHAPAPLPPQYRDQYDERDLLYDDMRYEREFEPQPRSRMYSADFDPERYDERNYEDSSRRQAPPRAKSMHIPASFTKSLNNQISPTRKVSQFIFCLLTFLTHVFQFKLVPKASRTRCL